MLNQESRYINDDGKIGVLVSPGYGAGWSSWLNSFGEYKEHPLFSPTIIQLVLDKKIGAEREADKDYSDLFEEIFSGGYFGGADDLCVEWIDKGTRIRIDEYDGAECIIKLEEEHYDLA